MGETGHLETVGLAKSFAGVRAVDGVDFCLRRGELVGLIGPNGSGKTTLVNLITGVVRADAGRVRCGGREWTWLPAHKVARIGIARTFQNIRLFGRLTVFDNVGVAAAVSARRGWRARTRQLLAQLDLSGAAEREVRTLPYGLQRRTELARALAGSPEFLFLDEPAAGLNETESRELGEALLAIRSEHGCGTVLIEHDVPLVMSVCERVVALNEGRVIASSSPAEIRNDSAVKRAYLG